MKAVYEIITERIVNSLKDGVVPWRRPWSAFATVPKNFVTKKAYNGVNNLLLGCQGYASPFWLTYKQAQDNGGQVRKGEKSTPIVFWNIKDRKDEPGKKSFLLRYFSVFNTEQVDGLTVPSTSAPKTDFSPIESCEKLVKLYKTAPKIEHRGDQAFYSPSFDHIVMPPKNSFASDPGYYSILFHELVHSTGHESRLKRDGITNPTLFASHSYSFEELVAEIGSAFLCAKAGIDTQTLENSAAYIGSWIKKLKSEPEWIVKAASKAGKAVDYMVGECEDATEEIAA